VLDDLLVEWVHAVLFLGNIALDTAGTTEPNGEPNGSHEFEVALVDELEG
jgi:hypothetical protein